MSRLISVFFSILLIGCDGPRPHEKRQSIREDLRVSQTENSPSGKDGNDSGSWDKSDDRINEDDADEDSKDNRRVNSSPFNRGVQWNEDIIAKFYQKNVGDNTLTIALEKYVFVAFGGHHGELPFETKDFYAVYERNALPKVKFVTTIIPDCPEETSHTVLYDNARDENPHTLNVACYTHSTRTKVFLVDFEKQSSEVNNSPYEYPMSFPLKDRGFDLLDKEVLKPLERGYSNVGRSLSTNNDKYVDYDQSGRQSGLAIFGNYGDGRPVLEKRILQEHKFEGVAGVSPVRVYFSPSLTAVLELSGADPKIIRMTSEKRVKKIWNKGALHFDLRTRESELNLDIYDFTAGYKYTRRTFASNGSSWRIAEIGFENKALYGFNGDFSCVVDLNASDNLCKVFYNSPLGPSQSIKVSANYLYILESDQSVTARFSLTDPLNPVLDQPPPPLPNDYYLRYLYSGSVYKLPSSWNCGLTAATDRNQLTVTLTDTSIRGSGSCSTEGSTVTYICRGRSRYCAQGGSQLIICNNGFTLDNSFYSRSGTGSCSQ